MPAPPRSPRRRAILEALAGELETHPGERVTTARLAQLVGVSEAALYRHFPSKAKMFEELIEFAEDSVFSAVNRILSEEPGAARRCEAVLTVLLTFAARNPGITRVLIGDALVGEHETLRARVSQFFNRVETQLKQVLREGGQRGEIPGEASAQWSAALLLAVAEGRLIQFVRSGFTRPPTEQWDPQWRLLAAALFPGTGTA